jgi:predicted Zn-dependent protease
VNRRGFLAGGCACGTLLAGGLARAQPDWQAPPRFTRPDLATDEGGLWAFMDREETRLRRSPFTIRDPRLQEYVQAIACRLAGDHCPDIRVHVIRTPLFNASMAPNGMMHVWTGLLLRVENEAQLAAILGHEIGHYLMRHSVERLRDVRSRTSFGQFLGLLGVAGAIGQLALIASLFAYTREQERDADRIGLALLRKAGYDPMEVPKVWGNLLLEIRARPDHDPERTSVMFATHPSPAERQEALKQLAELAPGGVTNAQLWEERIKPFRREWLVEEVKRGQHEESIALFTRMLASSPAQADYFCARGEVYRLRGTESDLDAAIADYLSAISIGSEPPEAHRGLGAVYRVRKQPELARASFQRYLEIAPNAPDVSMIKVYMEELGS